MADYDLPMVSSDKEDLKDKKLLRLDSSKTELVEYKRIFAPLTTETKIDMRNAADVIIKV